MVSEQIKGSPSDAAAGTIPFPLDDISTAAYVDNVRARADSTDSLLKFILSRLPASHFQDFGGVPYLEGDGGWAIARLLGLRVAPHESDMQSTPPGRFSEFAGAVQCVRVVTVSLGGGPGVTEHGDCDSLDPFLDTPKSKYRDRGATEDQIRELIKSDMSKKAYANAVSRAVSAWTGLRGKTFDDLRALGLQGDVSQVKIAKGSRGGKVAAISVADAAKASIGSKIAVASTIRRLVRREKYIDAVIGDTSATITVRVWTTKAPAPEWIAEGVDVFFQSITVGEYQGAKQYSADAGAIEQRDSAAPPDEAAQQQASAAPAPTAATKAAPAPATRHPRQMTADEYEDARSKGQF